MVRRHEKRWKKYLGSRRWGAGNIKKRRGKGSKGGKGYAGSHKQKWLHIIKYEPEHFGRKGFSPIKKRLKERKNIKTINVEKIYSAAKENKLEKRNGNFYFEFDGKVLGGGRIEVPVVIKASSFSRNAKKKIEEAGGSVLIGE